ncbi:hypothetical protein [Streptomyces sp. NPDC059786]|uniref:hypothetical protein n=1 Tax=Streptomyces sp. NPDC059786 TaxID=3346946 RepID=UPI0036476C29
MPADEATRADSAGVRARTGPRHAAPRKPLFTRINVPAGKAIAIAAMPTAVLMGMGLTPTLANADDHASTSSKSLTADEYQACVEALDGDDKDASASPSPSASASSSADEAEPTPSASAGSSDGSGSSDSAGSPDDASSPDSGSDDEAEATPTPSASKSAESGDSATATPSASESSKNPLDPLGIGDALKDILTPDEKESASATPTPSASSSAAADESGSDSASDSVKETTDKVTDTVKDTVDGAGKTVEDTTDEAKDAAGEAAEAAESAAASATPSPSASSSTDPGDCPAATDEEGGVEKVAALPDDPWYLDASSLLLKGADYQGVVKVKTANGTVKEVLKYVISDGTDIGDLHQTVNDKQAGKTYHVQAGAGTTSTIRDGKTVMYTESISGNLLGLIPVTFSPENPPPLNIPLIYFTKVKVVQAGQFGGTLTIPGLHQYTTD